MLAVDAVAQEFSTWGEAAQEGSPVGGRRGVGGADDDPLLALDLALSLS